MLTTYLLIYLIILNNIKQQSIRLINVLNLVKPKRFSKLYVTCKADKIIICKTIIRVPVTTFRHYYSTNIRNANSNLDNIGLPQHITKALGATKAIYIGVLTDRQAISTQDHKIGIYLLFNTIDSSFYVGGTYDISKRMHDYNSASYRQQNFATFIIQSLILHNASNYQIWILEYCSKLDLRNREQHYLDILEPNLNIAKTTTNRAYIATSLRKKIERNITVDSYNNSYFTDSKVAFAFYHSNKRLSKAQIAEFKAKFIRYKNISVQDLTLCTIDNIDNVGLTFFSNLQDVATSLNLFKPNLYNQNNFVILNKYYISWTPKPITTRSPITSNNVYKVKHTNSSNDWYFKDANLLINFLRINADLIPINYNITITVTATEAVLPGTYTITFIEKFVVNLK